MNFLLRFQDGRMTADKACGRGATGWTWSRGEGHQASPHSTVFERNEPLSAANFPYSYQSIGAVVRGVGGR